MTEREIMAAFNPQRNAPSSASRPVFGVPSLVPTAPTTSSKPGEMRIKAETPPPMDSMDWAPIDSSPAKQQTDNSWLRPQRFFAPENFTGLENLLSRTQLVDEDDMMQVDQEPSRYRPFTKPWRHWQVPAAIALSSVFFASLVFFLVRSRRPGSPFDPRPHSFPQPYSHSYSHEHPEL